MRKGALWINVLMMDTSKAVEALKEKQKALGKESWKADNSLDKAKLGGELNSVSSFVLHLLRKSVEWRNEGILPRFTGYDHSLLHQESQIVAIHMAETGKKTEVIVAIDPCPFYGLGGGQVPDSGTLLLANGHRWRVTDVFQPYEGGIALRLNPEDGQNVNERLESDKDYLQVRIFLISTACYPVTRLTAEKVGQLVKTEIDLEKRRGAEVHHTATHLLNAGLRAVLNTDIVQAGNSKTCAHKS